MFGSWIEADLDLDPECRFERVATQHDAKCANESPAHDGCMTTHELVTQFRFAAETAKELGALDVARAWELAAQRADAYFLAHALEELTLAQAATESGYSMAHIGRLIAQGAIDNVGKRHAPRVTRASLPRKPQSRRTRSSTSEEPDLVGRAFRRHA